MLHNKSESVLQLDSNKPVNNPGRAQSFSLENLSSSNKQLDALYHLSSKKDIEIHCTDKNICQNVKSTGGKKQNQFESVAVIVSSLDTNNNENKKIFKDKHEPIHVSHSAEFTDKKNLLTEKKSELTKYSKKNVHSSCKTLLDSIPTIKLSSKYNLENEELIQETSKFKKSHDLDYKRSNSSKRLSKHTVFKKRDSYCCTKKENSSNTDAFLNNQFFISKQHSPNHIKYSCKNHQHHRHHHQKIITSNKFSSTESNLNTYKENENLLAHYHEKFLRKSSNCRHIHHHHKKISDLQFLLPIHAVPNLTNSKSSEDLSNYSNCLHCCSSNSEIVLKPTLLFSQNGSFLCEKCYSSTSMLISETNKTSLKPQNASINKNSYIKSSVLLHKSPGKNTCKNKSLSPTPKIYSPSVSLSPSSSNAKKKEASRLSTTIKNIEKSSEALKDELLEKKKNFKKLNVQEKIFDHLNKSHGLVRASSSKASACKHNTKCHKCHSKRKTSLNSAIRGPTNYACTEAIKPDEIGLCLSCCTLSNLSQINIPLTIPSRSKSNICETCYTAATVVPQSPILLHSPIQLCSAHSSYSPKTLPKCSKLNSVINRIASPIHICPIITADLSKNKFDISNNKQNTPSTMSVPEFSETVITEFPQPIEINCNLLKSSLNNKKNLNVDSEISAAFTNLYRNKPPPDYFTNLFSNEKDDELDKPKVIDYLLAGSKKSDLTKKISFKNEENLIEKKDDFNNAENRSSNLPAKLIASEKNECQVIKKNLLKDELKTENKSEKNPNLIEINVNNHEKIDRVINLSEKQQTSNRNPMLNLLRKAQKTAEADISSLVESKKNLNEITTTENINNNKVKQEKKSTELESIKIKKDEQFESNFKSKKNSTISNNLAIEPTINCDLFKNEQKNKSEVISIDEPNLNKSRLMKILNKKELKPSSELSIVNDYKKENTEKNIETLSEQKNDETSINLESKKNFKNFNESKISLNKANISNSNSSSLNYTMKDNTSSSAMSRFKKKAASGFAVHFAKLTRYATVDNSSLNENSNKNNVATISGTLSNLNNRSVDKINTTNTTPKTENKKILKQPYNNPINNYSSNYNYNYNYNNNYNYNRHRLSVTAENMPKLTDLRKILNPEEEHRDLETVCKSFWDSFIDCQCIECTFNNAAKFITAFILFLTVALIVNALTFSRPTVILDRRSLRHPDNLNYQFKNFNLTKKIFLNKKQLDSINFSNYLYNSIKRKRDAKKFLNLDILSEPNLLTKIKMKKKPKSIKKKSKSTYGNLNSFKKKLN